MKFFVILSLFLSMFCTTAVANSVEGRRLGLAPGFQLVRPSDNRIVQVNSRTVVTVQAPIVGSNSRLRFPVMIGGQFYHLTENQMIGLGLVSKEECSGWRGNPTANNRRDLRQLATSAGNYQVSLNNLGSPNGNAWTSNCSQFITPTGGIGPWGSSFLNSAATMPVQGGTALDAMMMPNMWQVVCPGFALFTPQQKQHFIVSFVATKAMDEASCNPNAYNGNTPNPPGIGFFQLEGQGALRAGRSGACAAGYRGGVQNSLPINDQLACAASQMVSTQFARGRPFCTPGGYWQEANRMSGDICQTIRRYPGCGG